MTPRPLTPSEWAEVHQQPDVRALWAIDEDMTADDFASNVYAVHFDFFSGCPGFVGDLYLLQGDSLGDVPPVALVREKSGQLCIHQWTELVNS